MASIPSTEQTKHPNKGKPDTVRCPRLAAGPKRWRNGESKAVLSGSWRPACPVPQRLRGNTPRSLEDADKGGPARTGHGSPEAGTTPIPINCRRGGLRYIDQEYTHSSESGRTMPQTQMNHTNMLLNKRPKAKEDTCRTLFT